MRMGGTIKLHARQARFYSIRACALLRGEAKLAPLLIADVSLNLVQRGKIDEGDIGEGVMEKQRQYTRSEVATNNEKNEVLVILHDKVFNVHSFLNDHPGGEEVLLDHKGTDGSVDFNDVGHSEDAMNLMTKYQVGVLVESERTNKLPKKGWMVGYNTKKPEKYVQGPGKPFYLLIGGLLLLLFVMFYGY